MVPRKLFNSNRNCTLKKFFPLFLLFIGFVPVQARAVVDVSSLKNNSYISAKQKYNALSKKYYLKKYPFVTSDKGEWKFTGPSGWTSGFFPGSLWFIYEQTKEETWKKRAREWQKALTSQKNNKETHDIGFIIYSSFGNDYRLTGNITSKNILLSAAKTLATRYDPKIQAIRSWNSDAPRYEVIMDNMMNLQLLFWSSKNGGDRNLYNIALNHALKTQKDFIRSDGSVYQLVVYNQANGKIMGKSNPQGFSPNSVWSRGQAWAIYGFANVYKETGNKSFLQTARKTANYFINNLPSDNIPYWDFKAPKKALQPKDSSAAAVAASGLIKLSCLEISNYNKIKYRQVAERILNSLSTKYLDNDGQSLLSQGTYNKNMGEFNVGTSWGDYYFLEGLGNINKSCTDIW